MSSEIQFKGKPILESTIDKAEKKLYNKQTIAIRCLVDAVVKVTGTVTQTLYIFQGGNPVDVDIRDKDEILNKKRSRSCCGGSSNKNLFELA
jgi:hypothetical protein